MFIFVYICIYIIIVLAVILSHLFLNKYMKNYNFKIMNYEKYWMFFLEETDNNGRWLLTKTQLRVMRRPQAMEAFYHVFQQLERNKLERFFDQNRKVLVEQGKKIKNKTMHAYYAFVLSQMKLNGKLSEGYKELVLNYIKEDSSVYCRENSLKALYSMGDAEYISEAFRFLSKNRITHSEKLLTDGLLSFNGDFDRLSKTLMKGYTEFGECYRIAIINYLFHRNEHGFDVYLGHYLKRDISVDERCSCLRLLGKNCSAENEKILIHTLEKYQNRENWEPAAVAASFLGNFTDKEALGSLEVALQSPNWYVRINSAKALIKSNVGLANIRRILQGNDGYAKDALRYVITN